MRRAIQRVKLYVYDCDLSICLLSSPQKLARFPALILPQSRFYSSHDGFNLTKAESKDSPMDDDNDISNEELKKKIDGFYGGDVESLPSIFEAILKRKLSGKHVVADDELMKEIRQRMPGEVGDIDASDFDESQETDEEIEDSSDVEDDDRKG